MGADTIVTLKKELDTYLKGNNLQDYGRVGLAELLLDRADFHSVIIL